MHKKGVSFMEALITLAIIAILIIIAIPTYMSMKQQGCANKALGELKIIKVAIESYYKNNGAYPTETNYQDVLINATPNILTNKLNDPFTSNIPYAYKLSSADPATARYYVVYSIGAKKDGAVLVDETGRVSISGEAIWESNGSL